MARAALRLERWAARLWFGPPSLGLALARGLLAPLSWITRWIARNRRTQIHHSKQSCVGVDGGPPVVVIGNLLVGGTGKTPLVMSLARQLLARGWRPGLLVRGYRRQEESGVARRVGAEDTAEDIGDEALLLARGTGLPTAVGRNRAEALRVLQATSDCDVVLSDDGLQHVGLPRSIELAVFDARGVGNGHCLPAGPLREPLSGTGLLDALVLNGATTAPPVPHPQVFRFEVQPTAFVSLDGIEVWALSDFVATANTGRVDALAGVGFPERVFATLRSLGLRFDAHPLPDHARIEEAWLAGLPGAWIVMTEKDAVKCLGFDPALRARCVAIRVEAKIEDGLMDWLEGRLRG